MAKRRVLYISHDHPSIHVGGAEVFTYELFCAMRESGSYQPVLLARTVDTGHRLRAGTPFFSVDDDPDQILWAPEEFDGFWMTSRHKAQYTTHFRDLLRAYRPDVVHIQQ
ncbi:MAG: glycosyltransferase family 4 protein, partial [bacterium]|nr:glycosyltransferase family 4 protein [bacterium]